MHERKSLPAHREFMPKTRWQKARWGAKRRAGVDPHAS
jgi:hypothetical protein